MKKREVKVILANIRSTHNVGSIFRTADALGVDEIILSGTTPAPQDRFGRERADIAKVALGAEKSVLWKYEEDILVVIKNLKKSGYQIIAVEQAKNSTDYKKVKVAGKVAFIMGEEVEGINPEILKLAVVVAEIPMRGVKESLNVSVAFGVALFRMLNI
jgi:tRNA G18 (ribose-2'-O)-methylase SpoU